MARTDFLVLGGGVSGTTAAETLKEKNPDALVALVEDEPYPLYSRVMIPPYLKKRVGREALFLRKVSDYEAHGIDFYPSVKIIKLSPERQDAYAEDGRIFSYKKLLIASGGKPKHLVASSSKHPAASWELGAGSSLLRMHTLDDADYIKKEMAAANSKEALVIGEGFIALEFIETFLLNGFKVHALARGDFFNEKRLGEAGARILEENFERRGVILHKNAEVGSIGQVEVFLKNGDKITAAVLGAGVGLERNLGAFHALKTNKGIVTNEFLETSDPNIYASGDVAEFYDVFSGLNRVVGNWTNSFLQGRTAALNMLARRSLSEGGLDERIPFRAVSAYNIVNLGVNIAFVGCLDDADGFFEKAGEKELVRIFIKDGKVHGGVLINRFRDKVAITRLIEENRPVLQNELEKIF